MKAHTTTQWGLVGKSFALLSLAALVSACSTVGNRKADSAVMSLQSAAGEVQAERQALDLTLGALNEIMAQQNTDLKQPLKHYNAALNRLVATADRTEATGVKMAQRNSEYLQDWDKQLSTIEFDHIREVSEARKAEVTRRCEAVNHRYADSQSVVHPMINYFEDIRRALSLDLTTSGLEAMRPVAQNAVSNAEKVQTALEALASELTDSGTKMSSITTTAVTSNQ